MWFIGVEVEQETSAPPPNKNPGFFTQERSQEGEKRGSFTHEQNITCSQTKLDIFVHKQTIN